MQESLLLNDFLTVRNRFLAKRYCENAFSPQGYEPFSLQKGSDSLNLPQKQSGEGDSMRPGSLCRPKL